MSDLGHSLCLQQETVGGASRRNTTARTEPDNQEVKLDVRKRLPAESSSVSLDH